MNRADDRPVLLALRALGLGDLLTGVPALRALARSFPEHRRLLAMPATLAPLALHAAPVHDVVPVGALEPLPPSVGTPDVAVNLHGRGPQSHRLLLSTKPRRLVAFAHPSVPESRTMPSWRGDEHEVARWCRLLDEVAIPADPSDLDIAAPDVPVPGSVVGATLVHPGAARPARRWPAERWAAVAKAEVRSGRTVAVTGGPGEERLAASVARLAGLDRGAVHAGTRDPLRFAAMVAAAARVCCGDTGVAHLATALGTPSVVLFGPSPPARWGPPPDRAQHRALWKGREGEPLAMVPDPGLLEIQPEEVIQALQALAEMPRRVRGALVERG